MFVTADGTVQEVQFGCGPVDVACLMQEGLANILISGTITLGDQAADTLVNSVSVTNETDAWQAAFADWGKWAAAMIIFVGLAMLYNIGIGLITQNRRRVWMAVIGGTLAVPFASITVAVMQRIVTGVDATSAQVATAMQGGSLGAGILKAVGLDQLMASTTEYQWMPDSYVGEMLQRGVAVLSVGPFLAAVIVVLLVWVAGFVLLLAMEFRDLALLLLAAMAPMALMMIGQGKLAAWSEKWFSLVAGLTLMKPIVTGILTFIIGLRASTGGTLAEIVVSLLMLFVAALAPFWVVKLVDFTGGEVGAAMAGRPSMRQGGARVNSITNNRATRAAARSVARVFSKIGKK